MQIIAINCTSYRSNAQHIENCCGEVSSPSESPRRIGLVFPSNSAKTAASLVPFSHHVSSIFLTHGQLASITRELPVPLL